MMKKATLALLTGVLITASLSSTLSYAEGPGNGPDRQWREQGGQHQRDDRGGRPDRHQDRGHPGERDRFAWNGHDFRRGEPLPPRYRGHDYRVNDWRGRGLYEPPRGAYWSYIDGNYVLVAAATGVITSIILSSALGHN